MNLKENVAQARNTVTEASNAFSIKPAQSEKISGLIVLFVLFQECT